MRLMDKYVYLSKLPKMMIIQLKGDAWEIRKIFKKLDFNKNFILSNDEDNPISNI